jgi:hypothetical protein
MAAVRRGSLTIGYRRLPASHYQLLRTSRCAAGWRCGTLLGVRIARYGDERRLAFGQVAQVYDRVRPSYAPVVIDAMLEFAGVRDGGRVLEVGAGRTARAVGVRAPA